MNAIVPSRSPNRLEPDRVATGALPSRSGDAVSRRRRPFRDNPRLILAGIALLVAILAIMLALIHRTPKLTPDVLSEVVLYALSVADVTILVVFLWLLGR